MSCQKRYSVNIVKRETFLILSNVPCVSVPRWMSPMAYHFMHLAHVFYILSLCWRNILAPTGFAGIDLQYLVNVVYFTTVVAAFVVCITSLKSGMFFMIFLSLHDLHELLWGSITNLSIQCRFGCVCDSHASLVFKRITMIVVNKQVLLQVLHWCL